MTRGVDVLQGVSAHAYHVIPGELERVAVSPEREAVLAHLAQISSDRFVEFIADVLVHVEGHKLVDITDGPGDEKQDILTTTPKGDRHLTQSKFTSSYKNNTSGDELDLLFSACLRKNCRSALWVTNADLTPQAKRYVTDVEYLRGWRGPKELAPSIDYWNGARIWERVRKSTAILNKWFSGMAQTSGLRSFAFDLVLYQMPSGEPTGPGAADVAKLLATSATVVPGSASGTFVVELDKSLSFNLSDWVRGSSELGLPYVQPGGGDSVGNLPLRILRVQASVSPAVGGYDPVLYRDKIAVLILNVLATAPDGNWWYAAASVLQGLVFLQDISRAVLVPVEDAASYVRVGTGSAEPEMAWAFEPGDEFDRVEQPDDPADRFWRHKASGVELRVFVSQRTDITTALEIHLRQQEVVRRLRTYRFKAVEASSAADIDTVRRLSRPTWFVLRGDDGTLFFAFPTAEETRHIDRVEGALVRRGTRVLSVRDEDREVIIKQIDTAPSEAPEVLTSEHGRVTPVGLTERIFWLSCQVPLSTPPDLARRLELLKWKADYEVRHGYDLLQSRDAATFTAEELRGLLFDLMSIRGSRSVDVGFLEGSAWVNYRVNERSPAAASVLAPAHVADFLALDAEYRRILSPLATT
jgi:hypothetical protein